MSSTEGPSFASDDHTTHGLVLRRFIQSRLERTPHVLIETVEDVLLECERQHARIQLGEQGLTCMQGQRKARA